MDSTLWAAIISAIAIIVAVLLTAFLTSKYTKRKTENVYLNLMQDSYKKLISDLEKTTKRLIEEREDEIKRRKKSEIEIDDIRTKLQAVMIKLGIIEPQRCLLLECERRVLP